MKKIILFSITLIFSQDITFTPGSLNFGSLDIGQSASLNLTINNNTSGLLNITNIYSDDEQFYAPIPMINIPGNSSGDIEIIFFAQSNGTSESILYLETNLESIPILEIPCIGTAINPISGEISGNWTIDNSPYFIVNDILIPENDSLILEPGIEIIVDGDYRFTGDGNIIAKGDPNNLIKFFNDENNDGWKGILLNSTSNSVFNYCDIRGVNGQNWHWGEFNEQFTDQFDWNVSGTGWDNGMFSITTDENSLSSNATTKYPIYISQDNTILSVDITASSNDSGNNHALVIIYASRDNSTWIKLVGSGGSGYHNNYEGNNNGINNINLNQFLYDQIYFKIYLYAVNLYYTQAYDKTARVSQFQISGLENTAGIICDSCTVDISNTQIKDNGIGIYSAGTDVELTNVNLIDNHLSLASLNNEIWVHNSIFYNNEDHMHENRNSDIYNSYSLFDSNPYFIDDYGHLHEDYSPCIDTGHPNTFDSCMPPGQGAVLADIGMYGGNNNCGNDLSNIPDGAPIIENIFDIPQDQGGFVGVQFTASIFDYIHPAYNISKYSFWRDLQEDSEIPQNISSNPNFGNYFVNNRDDYWELISEMPAVGFDQYGFTLPTLADSSNNGSFYSEFLIIAHTQDSTIFFPSESQLGQSVDNLSPDIPYNFNIQQNDTYNHLTWSMNLLDDFSHFEIYKNNNYYTSTIDTFYFDINNNSEDFSYSIFSFDHNGNRSETSVNNTQSIIGLSYGNNLISLRGNTYTNITELLMEDLGDVNFILGQGLGLFKTEEGWSGNLNTLDHFSGYWLNISANRNWSLPYQGGFSDPCLQYDLSFGNNLISYQGNNQSTILALGDSELSEHFNFILGQGVGLFNTDQGWSGNLNTLEPKKAYWLNVTSSYPWYVQGEGTPFRWNVNHGCEEPVVDLTKEIVDPFEAIPDEFQFVQSTEQAFYLIEELLVNNQYPQIGDIIIALNQDVLVGSAEYTGTFTALPVMGRDISEQTIGFIEAGQVASLKLYKASTGEIIDLEADLEPFSNLLVSEVQSVTGSTAIIPTDYALHPSYPNPFNPVTNISYALPIEAQILLNVYDVEGRKITTLTEGIRTAGTHSVKWNAEGYPSGVYFVKLDAGEFTQTQKLMLVK